MDARRLQDGIVRYRRCRLRMADLYDAKNQRDHHQILPVRQRQHDQRRQIRIRGRLRRPSKGDNELQRAQRRHGHPQRLRHRPPSEFRSNAVRYRQQWRGILGEVTGFGLRRVPRIHRP